MNADLAESKEYQCFQKFTKGAEFYQLTQGEEAVFPGFDVNKAEDLNKMRDYFYDALPAHRQPQNVQNYKSPRLSQMQVGAALIAREEYRRYEKEHTPKVDTRASAASTNTHHPLGRCPDVSRRIRC